MCVFLWRGGGGRTSPRGKLAVRAVSWGKPSHLMQGVPNGEGPQPRACLCPQRGSATREFPRVAPAPQPRGGLFGWRRGAAGAPNRSRLWAGAALAGSLRRASSKDGQRVRRHLRPRSPLARGPALRPVPEPSPEVGAGRTRCPRPAGGKRAEPGAGERGRAASRARPRQRRGDNGRAGGGQGRAQGDRRPPYLTCAASRDRGTRAPGPAGGVRCPRGESLREAPRGGDGLPAGNAGPGAQTRGSRKPLQRPEEGVRG